jgi:hypothetical protein
MHHPAVRAAAASALALLAFALLIFQRRSAAPARPAAAAPRVLLRVAGTEISEADVARHQAVASLYLGVEGERQALSDLCERSLLKQAAAGEPGPSQVEVRQETLRRKAVIAATHLEGRAGRTHSAVSPFARADQLLAAAGVSPADLDAEVRDDLAARNLRRRAEIAARLPDLSRICQPGLTQEGLP